MYIICYQSIQVSRYYVPECQPTESVYSIPCSVNLPPVHPPHIIPPSAISTASILAGCVSPNPFLAPNSRPCTSKLTTFKEVHFNINSLRFTTHNFVSTNTSQHSFATSLFLQVTPSTLFRFLHSFTITIFATHESSTVIPRVNRPTTKPLHKHPQQPLSPNSR